MWDDFLTNTGSLVKPKTVLIIYYSFSNQTLNVVNGLAKGLEEGGVIVQFEQLKPLQPPPFPTDSYFKALRMMFAAFMRHQIAVQKPVAVNSCDWDLVICAGPTWSYHPSGPMLYFLSQFAGESLAGRLVLPFICCRTYWRLHAWEVRRLLERAGARVLSAMAVRHPFQGFWCTFGVFAKLAGKMPHFCQHMLQTYCPRFGYTQQQIEAVRNIGLRIAQALSEGNMDEKFRV